MKTKIILIAVLLSVQSLSAKNFCISKPTVAVKASSGDFIFFKANRNGRDVVMNWAYQNPVLVVFYYIERSTDGVHFTLLTDVMSYGEPWYRFRDRNVPAGGVTYYRITAYQHDGNISYSSLESVRNQGNGCH